MYISRKGSTWTLCTIFTYALPVSRGGVRIRSEKRCNFDLVVLKQSRIQGMLQTQYGVETPEQLYVHIEAGT